LVERGSLPAQPVICPTLYRSGTLLTEEDQHQLDYASLPKPDPKRKDFIRLCIIGTIFGIAYSAFLLWWTLFR
jgi:hypothetical protein